MECIEERMSWPQLHKYSCRLKMQKEPKGHMKEMENIFSPKNILGRYLWTLKISHALSIAFWRKIYKGMNREKIFIIDGCLGFGSFRSSNNTLKFDRTAHQMPVSFVLVDAESSQHAKPTTISLADTSKGGKKPKKTV